MKEIHNKRETIRAKFFLIQLPFTLVLITGIMSMAQWIAYGWLVVAAALFVLTLVAVFLLQLNFVRINEFEDRWEIRYYTISPFGPNYRMILVEKKNLVHAEIITRWQGLRKVLVIEELIKGERAIYPPISLSLFSTQVADEITRTLVP